MIGWVVYRIEDGEVAFLGIYKTKGDAETDIKIMKDLGEGDGLTVEGTHFIGFGLPEALN